MTLSELAIAVAEELAVLGAGQSLSAEDDALIKRRYERVRLLYGHRGYMHWAATDDIPDGADDGTTLLTAYSCARPFGLPKDPALREEGERLLALYRDRGYPRKTTKFKAF
ncbi:MAG: hypothetical protein GY952_06765 [Rhodobacteraceae bacterium]|nr:hypothetical protein [Paracoccaceae bacterium]